MRFKVGSSTSDDTKVKYLDTAVILCDGDTLTVTHTITMGGEEFKAYSVIKCEDFKDESFED